MQHHLAPPETRVPDGAAYTWSAEQVADALGIALTTFRNRRRHLEGNGFPRPLPGLDRSRWSSEAVRAWIALSGSEG